MKQKKSLPELDTTKRKCTSVDQLLDGTRHPGSNCIESKVSEIIMKTGHVNLKGKDKFTRAKLASVMEKSDTNAKIDEKGIHSESPQTEKLMTNRKQDTLTENPIGQDQIKCPQIQFCKCLEQKQMESRRIPNNNPPEVLTNNCCKKITFPNAQ